MGEHLPVLQVVLPLFTAPLIVLVRHRGFAWIATTLVSYTCLAIAVALAVRVTNSGPISYAIGNWPPPWGIEYRIDTLSAFVLVLVSSMASHEFSWKGAILNAIILVLISLGAFVYGINLQMPVWPAFLAS